MDITVEKWHMLLIISGIYVGLSFLLRAELALTCGEKPLSPKAYWAELDIIRKLILAYWVLSGISTVLSANRSTAFFGGTRSEGFLAITVYCFSFLLISRQAVPHKLLLWTFGAAMTLNCLICLLQFAGRNPFGLYPEGMNYYDANTLYAGEFLGTIGNADLQSALLALAIPLFAVSILKSEGKARFLSAIPLALCLAVLIKARVAGGIVGIAGCVLVAAPALSKKKHTRRMLVFASIGICILGLAAVFLFGRHFHGTVYELSELLHGRCEDSFGSGRIYIWRNVLAIVPERPLFGGGPDTLGLRMNAGFERFNETLGVLLQSSIDAAHNEYLNLLVNQGGLALAAYLAALFCAAVRWIRCGSETPAAAACGSAVLGYSIQAFFGLSSPITTPFFWIAFAILVHALPAKKATQSAPKTAKRQSLHGDK